MKPALCCVPLRNAGNSLVIQMGGRGQFVINVQYFAHAVVHCVVLYFICVSVFQMTLC